MGRHPQLTASALSLRLQAGGPATALALAAAARVDRTTVARRLGDLGEQVVSFGAARRTRYALRRTVRNTGERWPLYWVDERGRARVWATLQSVHGGWALEWAELTQPPTWTRAAGEVDGLWQGFPFFLGELRPQGFVGRALSRQWSDTLGLPMDPENWSDDDTLVFLHARGDDLPGDLIVGDLSLERELARQVRSPLLAEVSDYAGLAAAALAGEVAGSSAGGEQPKFLTWRRDSADQPEAVLVKFTASIASPPGRRWADLLAAEGHAHAVLAENGFTTGEARVVDDHERRYLEIPRFDRVGSSGRRGVISLGTLNAAFVDDVRSDWVSRAEALRRVELVDAAGVDVVRRLACFGSLIGNSDMHPGNLGFWFDDTLPFRPAPAYDMLPMMWAPTGQGEVRDPTFAPVPPVPASQSAWSEAAGWAETFWARVASDETRVSPAFRAIAARAGTTVAGLRVRFG